MVMVNVVIILRDGHRVETPSGERESSQVNVEFLQILRLFLSIPSCLLSNQSLVICVVGTP